MKATETLLTYAVVRLPTVWNKFNFAHA